MSNPCINRWGINTFWYKFWYSDVRYSENLKQDSVILKLINIYMFYGVNCQHNIFFTSYWYLSKNISLNFPSYFRFFDYKNKTLGLKSSYRLRQRTNDIYPMRVWLLRYDKWILINFYWFQPMKKKYNPTNSKFKTSTDVFNLIGSSQFTTNSIKKIKTLYSLSFFKTFLNRTYYNF
jgi:hypothetical protein